ncbi:hypothetical protein GC175_06250 [bacterium]|nr:hypothetical protein [bacterium]
MTEAASIPFDMNAALSQFLAQWMAQVGPELTVAARAAALSHHVNSLLLSAMLPALTADESMRTLEQLTQLGMLEQGRSIDGMPQYTFQTALRPLLLRHWLEQDPHALRRANAAAVVYYRARPTDEWTDLEIVYHELGVDDDRGIGHFRTLFEQIRQARRFDQLEQLLRYADEQRAVLGKTARAWIDLHRLRVDIAYGNPVSVEMIDSFIEEHADPALRAQALILRAEVESRTGRLSTAVGHYRRAQALLVRLRDHVGEARVEEACGLLFVQMATNADGFATSQSGLQTSAVNWLFRIQHAPFLFYRWCSRRTVWLPNLYFGGDYQDWIVARLLYAAIAAFQRSVGLLKKVTPEETPNTQFDLPILDLHIRMADLYHRVGEWERANRHFTRLAQDPAVNADPYRRATLAVGQGRAALARNEPDLALEPLSFARQTALRYGDPRLLHQISSLLAEAYWCEDKQDDALRLYSEAVRSGQETNDLLSVTRLAAHLENLSGQPQQSPVTRAQIAEIVGAVEQQAYIARFPGGWRRFFRSLATLVVTPITYVFVTILVIALNGLSAFAELIVLTGPVADLLLAIPLIVGMALSAIWLYELLYVGIGWLFVRGVSARMLAERQPQYVVLLPESLIVRDEDGIDHELSWPSVAQMVTLDRAIWRAPLALFSRMAVLSSERALVIEGIVNDYARLQRQICERTGAWAQQKSFDFSFLRSRGSWMALLATIFLTVLALRGDLDPTGEMGIVSVAEAGMSYELIVSSVLFWLGLWTILLFPLFGLVRLIWSNWQARRMLKPQLSFSVAWSSWAALLLIGLLTLYWIATLGA